MGKIIRLTEAELVKAVEKTIERTKKLDEEKTVKFIILQNRN